MILSQIEIMVEKMLRERVVAPLTRRSDVVLASGVDSEIVREATVWNVIRKVSERGLHACQTREKSGRALHVASL
jgi:hypothetical protein